MKASDLFVRCLENEGVEYIFGIPGEENLDVMDSMIGSSIKFITTRHEQGAAFMADVYGRLTGKAGVCLATLGPGATNLVTGFADANMDRAPIIGIAGQGATTRMHKESHQVLEQVDQVEHLVAFLVHARGRALPGNADDRRAVHVGVGKTGDEVGRAGSERRQANAGLAGEAAVNVGHEGGALLVPGGDELDTAADQRIHDVEIFFAGNPEYVFHALVFEAAHEQVAGFHFYPRKSFSQYNASAGAPRSFEIAARGTQYLFLI